MANLGDAVKLIGIFVVGAMLHHHFVGGAAKTQEEKDYGLVEKFLLGKNGTEVRPSLPFLWVHVTHEVNSRWWMSFGSRNTSKVNLPYLGLTVDSIARSCEADFNVCVIDDADIAALLPDADFGLARLAEPRLSQARDLALLTLLYSYGGVLVSPAYISLRSLRNIHDEAVSRNLLLIGEQRAKSVVANDTPLAPRMGLLAASPECEAVAKLCAQAKRICGGIPSAAPEFEGDLGLSMASLVASGEAGLIPAWHIGVIDSKGGEVTLDRLLGSTFIDFASDVAGVLLPQSEILSRTAYGWFLRLSADQVLKSDTVAGKLLCGTTASFSKDAPLPPQCSRGLGAVASHSQAK